MSHRVNMSNITDNGNRMVVDDDLHTYAMVAWVASLAHKDQQRKTGGAYIMHPLGVSCLIDPAWSKLDNMCVAVCHDVLEDVPHMLDYAKEELDKYGFRIAEPEPWDFLSPKGKLSHLLAVCRNGNMRWARSITSKVMELTVVWPRPDHPEDDPKDKVAKKAWEVERIQNLSMDAASVTKADKTFNSLNPIPGRDPVKEAAKYQRYFDAVDARMSEE